MITRPTTCDARVTRIGCGHRVRTGFVPVVLACLLFVWQPLAAQPPGVPAGPVAPAVAPDSLDTPVSVSQPGDSLVATGLPAGDSLAAPADTVPTRLGKLRNTFRRIQPRRGMPTPRAILPTEAFPLVANTEPWNGDSARIRRLFPDRPADDLAEELHAWVPGPQQDAGPIGQRQFLALDGIDDRESGVLLDGEELHNRLDGRTDLSLLSGNLLDRRRTSLWQRLAPGHAGGLLELQGQPVGDSIAVNVDWLDGFLGLVNTEMVASRPVGRGGFQLGTRQVYTHARVPGAKAQENLFFGHWEHPLPAGWVFRADKRVRRHNGELLDSGNDRRIRQNLNRFRLWQERSSQPFTLGLDYQSRWDRNSYGGERRLNDVANFRRLEVQGHSRRDSSSTVLDLGLWLERQRLHSLGLDRRLMEHGFKAAGHHPLAGGLRLAGSGRAGLRSDREHPFWDLGLGLSGTVSTRQLDWEILGQAGRRPPWADQLWLERLPGEREEASDPLRRAAQARLLPDPDLPDTRWLRQEVRFGWNSLWPLGGQGRLGLRAWRVRFKDQAVERELQDDSGDFGWRAIDRVQDGMQFHLQGRFGPTWSLRFSQAWLPESEVSLSREVPTFLTDAALGWQRRYFSDELHVRATLGAHNEFGAVDVNGDDLWTRPEAWLLIHAQRGRFTLWWSARNLLRAENARINSRTLNGYEEILGVRWDFLD